MNTYYLEQREPKSRKLGVPEPTKWLPVSTHKDAVMAFYQLRVHRDRLPGGTFRLRHVLDQIVG